jgi:exodeoxyribonuclease-3
VRVITLNLNGIRSAASKGAFDWLAQQDADVILLQEVRAQEHQIPPEILEGYVAYWNLAEKPGYSGVGALTRLTPKRVTRGIGMPDFDAEGRVLQLEFKDWNALSVYVPSGSSGEARQVVKMRFLEAFLEHAAQLGREGKDVLMAGDFNIAHRQIDLKNWRSNQQNSGFLPEERAWLDQLLGVGYADTFRDLVGPEAVHYSWWSNRGRARENDVGWRLDYHFCTPGLSGRARQASIYRDRFFSDHAPVLIEYSVD